MFYLGADAIIDQRHLLEKLGKLARIHSMIELLLALLQISLQLHVVLRSSLTALAGHLEMNLSLVEVQQHLVERNVALINLTFLDNPDELGSRRNDRVGALLNYLVQVGRLEQALNAASGECTVK